MKYRYTAELRRQRERDLALADRVRRAFEGGIVAIDRFAASVQRVLSPPNHAARSVIRSQRRRRHR